MLRARFSEETVSLTHTIPNTAAQCGHRSSSYVSLIKAVLLHDALETLHNCEILFGMRRSPGRFRALLDNEYS